MYRKGSRRVHWTHWKAGEVYYRENGTKPFKLLEVHEFGSYEAQYLNLTYPTYDVKQYLIEAEIEEEENEMANNKLYQVKDQELYGVHIATNSEGKIVLEMKGTNEVKAYSKDQLEEVMPYTVGVKFSVGGQNYHFETDKGSVSVGDLIVRMDGSYEGSFGEVVSVDTKSKQATKRLDAVVIQGTRIK
jgi:hypothetical protein